AVCVDLDAAAAPAYSFGVVSDVRFLDAKQHGKAMKQAGRRPAVDLGGGGERLGVERVGAWRDVHRGLLETLALQGIGGFVRLCRLVEEGDDGVLHSSPPFNAMSAGAAESRCPAG